MREIIMPVLGQSVEEAEIVTWLKNEGDTVFEGEVLFTIQTDKAEIECESTAAGVLRKIIVTAGIEVPVKTVVALVGDAGEDLPDLAQYAVAKKAAQAAAPNAKQSGASPAKPTSATVSHQLAAPSAIDASVSPRAKKLAGDHHVNAQRLSGSGVGGRVMAEDVQAYLDGLNDMRITPVAKRIASEAALDVRGIKGTGIGEKITREDVEAALAQLGNTSNSQSSAPPPGVNRIPLSPMRKIIARRMSDSKFSAPHYYVTVEIDMTQTRAFRASITDMKVSYNDFVLCAVAKTLREFPKVNVRWAGDSIDEVEDINLGMAVALDAGLVVPVIRNADTLNIRQLSEESKRLSQKAQKGALIPDDYQGNTFTISNLGAFGVDQFTAIINQPDSAIIAVGQMKDRVVVVDGQIVVRPIMKMTISSDHRAIDGAVAAKFMGRIKERLESGDFD